MDFFHTTYYLIIWLITWVCIFVHLAREERRRPDLNGPNCLVLIGAVLSFCIMLGLGLFHDHLRAERHKQEQLRR